MSLLSQIGAAAVAFAIGSGSAWYAASSHYEAEAESARRVAEDAREEVREQARTEGERIAQGLRTELAERARYTHQLMERQSHAPRPLVASCGPAAQAAQLAAQPAPAVLSAGAAAEASEPQLVLVPLPVPVAELSLGAVSLWNSALAGVDVPAGACRLDDATEGACAAGAGLRLEDAWRNHALNAQLCAEDRARYERLIEFVRTSWNPQR